MTSFERKLAYGVISVWLGLSICTNTLRLAARVLAHVPVSLPDSIFLQWQWVIQAVAGAVLAMYAWRTRRSSYWLLRWLAASALIYVGNEIGQVLSLLIMRAARKTTLRPLKYMLQQILVIDITHFFILALGVVAVVMMIDWYFESVRRETEAAALTVTIADARARSLRLTLQPAEVRASLRRIEELLPHDPAAAELAILHVSDVLRAALLRAREGARA